ncbi:hypothetical protein HAU30_09175 [Weissella confusa]|uniref:hypothetical protein n=1 Tax=Weissella confusa TaxID=1583 RepID=UPI0018F1E43F|nr:hypothetical protein [Weissella confusa]MBJ7680630.1 hypothetical protein [Weissella confusa]
MTKYVIDLPEGVKFIVGIGYAILSEKELLRIPVSQLELYVEPTVAENATVEKRVIELPADVIAELKTIKEDNGDDNLQGFMNDVNDDDELWQNVEEINFSGMPTDALLGEWWLEHVEFVPKKEQQYAVETKLGYVMAIYSGPGKKLGVSEFTYDDYTQNFTENEADEIIAGLGGENGLLKPRKVKVDD